MHREEVRAEMTFPPSPGQHLDKTPGHTCFPSVLGVCGRPEREEGGVHESQRDSSDKAVMPLPGDVENIFLPKGYTTLGGGSLINEHSHPRPLVLGASQGSALPEADKS